MLGEILPCSQWNHTGREQQIVLFKKEKRNRDLITSEYFFLWDMEFVLVLNKKTQTLNFLLLSDTFTLHWLRDQILTFSWIIFKSIYMQSNSKLNQVVRNWGSIMQIPCLHFLLAYGFQQYRDSRNLCKIIIEAKAGIWMWVVLLFEIKKE